MLGWFFDHRVGSRLFKYGWQPNQLPEHMTFSHICMALRDNGYDLDRAADLWSRVLSGDESAKQKMRQDAGVFGIMYLGGSRY